MKRNFRIYGIIAIAVLLLLITTSGVPIIDTFAEKAIEVGRNTALLVTFIGITGGLIADTIYYFNFANIDEFSSKWNPIVSGANANHAIVAVVNSFLMLLQPFYVIAIVLTGVYLLFIAGTPAGRAKAKSNFWKLVFSMVVVTLSMQLFQIILNLSAALTVGVVNIAGISGLTVQGIMLPFTMLLMGLGALSIALGPFALVTFGIIAILVNLPIFIIIQLRYVILLILAMLFPFTIFFHYLDLQFTKAFAAKLVRLTFIWTFLPVVIMLAVAGADIAIESYAEQCGPLQYLTYIPGVGALISLIYSLFDASCLAMIGMSLVGIIIIAVTPLMMSGVMTWIGAGLAMAGMAYFGRSWATPLTTFGGLLAGMGPGAFMMGGTQAMFRGMAPGAGGPTSASDVMAQKRQGIMKDYEQTEFKDLKNKPIEERTSIEHKRFGQLEKKDAELGKFDKHLEDRGFKTPDDLGRIGPKDAEKIVRDFEVGKYKETGLGKKEEFVREKFGSLGQKIGEKLSRRRTP